MSSPFDHKPELRTACAYIVAFHREDHEALRILSTDVEFLIRGLVLLTTAGWASYMGISDMNLPLKQKELLVADAVETILKA